jgi:serine/threonine protein kinase
MCLF